MREFGPYTLGLLCGHRSATVFDLNNPGPYSAFGEGSKEFGSPGEACVR